MAEPTRQLDDGRGDARRIRGVADVSALITERLHRAFPEPLWARGEVLNCVFDEHGAAHFDLVEHPPDPDAAAPAADAGGAQRGADDHPAAGNAPAELHVHLTREAFARVRAALAPHNLDPRDLLYDGQSVLVSGQLTYAGNRVGLRMDGLDHHATTGMLAAAKAAARARLTDANLDLRQRHLPTPTAPRRVAVIGGAHDTGLRAALAAMTESELSIQARSITVGLEGRGAVAALAEAIAHAADGDDEVVLLVRGEGIGASRAPFDAEPVAHAIAHARIPVVTGIQVDQPTLADEVAHLACGSPAKAGSEVVQRLRGSLRRLHTTERDTQEHARAALDRIEAAYTAASQALSTVEQAADARSRRTMRRRVTGRLGLAAAALAGLLVLVALATPLQRVALAVAAGLGCVLILARIATRRNHHAMHPRPAAPPRSFEEAMARLDAIRGELTVTAAPETVVALSQEAAELRRYCESLLGWAEQALTSGVSPPTPPAPRREETR